MLCKKSNLVSNLIIFVLAIAPFAVMLFNVEQLKQDGLFLKTNCNLTIGAGINSGFTDIGRLLFVLSIVFFIILVIGFTLNHKKLLKKETNHSPKEIRVKKETKTPVSEYDFKI